MTARAGPPVAAIVILLVFAHLAPALAQSATAPHGLAWNRTGLPAVFPLQVKTREGQDLFLTLENATTGAEAMGANIESGRFFKLLVPPGTYRLRFDPTGRDAIGKEAFLLPEPLSFEIRGSAKKAGHLVDITGLSVNRPNGAEIRPQSICQVLEQDFEPRFPGQEFNDSGTLLPDRPRDWSGYPGVNIRAYYCD
ncbi:hypothetical protein [Aliiruegeria lutimaris]|uniref:Uncharacterized protein n=1 Tax=Aliiruegeria lutimaris TaxID=571298 RepID=A0A1G8R8M4_9RHOB|nr:hypothetical protein [Aliiruegeria lutimaris]SDJ12740.1 hypothetical protein SAMN04488026_101276 [Aliiruegeria lutimaris]